MSPNEPAIKLDDVWVKPDEAQKSGVFNSVNKGYQRCFKPLLFSCLASLCRGLVRWKLIMKIQLNTRNRQSKPCRHVIAYIPLCTVDDMLFLRSVKVQIIWEYIWFKTVFKNSSSK